MSNITNISNSQLNIIINNTNNSDSKNSSLAIQEEAKNKFLNINDQVELLTKHQEIKQNKKIDFNKLEQKLGIDSEKWGVEAVSDDIFNFTKNVFKTYKINHEGEENSKILKSFYDLAKKSVTQGYNEALDFLGTLPEDVASLAKGTFDRTIQKLDAWFENGGEDVEEISIENPENETKNETVNTPEVEKAHLTTQELLKESEEIKAKVLDLLKQEGLYLKEKSSKKPNYNFEA